MLLPWHPSCSPYDYRMSDIRVPSTTCWCRAAVRLVAIMSLSAGLAHAGSPVAVLTSPVPQMSYFGWSVAGSKKMAVVGAPWRYIAGPQIVGEAYLFDLKTGTLLQTLSNPNTLANDNVTQDRFASAVAMVGTNTVAVGAADAFVVGRIYLFDAFTGELRRTVLPPPGGSAFGASLAADGNRLLVTGLLNLSPQDLRGAVFLVDGDTGEILQTFVGEGVFTDGFGTALAIRGTAVLIGASGSATGAYLFDATSGSLLHRFVSPEGGGAVALTRDRVFVGTVNDDTVYVFDRSTGALVTTLAAPSPIAHSFGGLGSLAMIGRDLVIGERGGPAYLVRGRSGRVLKTFPVPSVGSLAVFGTPVASTGSRVLVGAINSSGGSATSATDYGAVYVFHR